MPVVAQPVSLPMRPPLPRWVTVLGAVVVAHAIVLLAWLLNRPPQSPDEEVPPGEPATAVARPLNAPVRPAPKTFAANTYMPGRREIETSGAIDLTRFSPGRELAYIEDARVWWESDNDEQDEEDDHTVHRAVIEPLKRLIELASQRQARVKVQDTYRPVGIHNPKSLHREGRAVDLTCEGLPLEELAKLCWQAGFDWVYYETKGGPHVHCSVRREQGPSLQTEATVAAATRQMEGVD